tara:strand:- start:1465 stop:2172 length:708 start_codon:yes stop_codon:yes gene_type:complete
MSKIANQYISGRLIKRYKRFFADIQLDYNKETITAHCPNTGSMQGLLEKGNPVFVTKADDPKRKLKYTLEIIKSSSANVGINTHKANRIVEDAIEQHMIPELGKYDSYKREVKYGTNSRIDFLLSDNDNQTYIEVKNVTLSRKKGTAEFPDAITERGSRHLIELSKLPDKNTRAVMLFLIQRDDCKKFQIAKDIDQTYYNNFKTVIKEGVEIICYNCSFESDQIRVNKKIKLINE